MTHSAKYLAPTEAAVNQELERLMGNPDYVIAAVVNNSFGDVQERYRRFTGASAPVSREKMVAVLQNMRQTGRKVLVREIISVRWQRNGNGPMDIAISSLQSESAARLGDPSAQAFRAKSLPVFGPWQEGQADPWAGDRPAPGTTPTAESNDFWNSLPGILTAAGGLVNAFTGNAQPTTTGGSGAGAPPAQPGTNWMKVIVILLVVAAVATGIALIIRARQKK